MEAAAGIHRVINAKMADEIRLVSVRRGHDPRSFALVLLGGAGPVHGGRLAAELGIPRLVVPPVPGVLSAQGLLVADVEHDRAETVAVHSDDAEVGAFEATFARLELHVAARMASDRVPPEEVMTTRFADMRYVGQSYTLEVALEQSGETTDLRGAVDQFHTDHERVYGYASHESAVEFVNLRVVQSWGLPSPALGLGSPTEAPPPARVRRAYFDETGGLVETQVVHRSSLAEGERLDGPAIVEQDDTTLVVYPEQTAVLDGANNLIVSLPGAQT